VRAKVCNLMPSAETYQLELTSAAASSAPVRSLPLAYLQCDDLLLDDAVFTVAAGTFACWCVCRVECCSLVNTDPFAVTTHTCHCPLLFVATSITNQHQNNETNDRCDGGRRHAEQHVAPRCRLVVATST
jgi:hypothetical protein